jgi:hypothetical protein
MKLPSVLAAVSALIAATCFAEVPAEARDCPEADARRWLKQRSSLKPQGTYR